MRSCKCTDVDMFHGIDFKKLPRSNYISFNDINMDSIYYYTKNGDNYNRIFITENIYSKWFDIRLDVFNLCFMDLVDFRNKRIMEVLDE